MTVISQANVACGFHAGDDATMAQICGWAVRHGVEVGAQVSYRDREHFGRVALDVEPLTLARDVDEQVRALTRIAGRVGAVVGYLKPHGALYHRAAVDDAQAGAVVEVCVRHQLPVMCLPGSLLLRLAAAAGLDVRREFFADRGYDDSGGLVPRGTDGDVIADPGVVEARVRQLVVSGTVTSVGGVRLPVEVDSVCVHGDSPDAISLARAVRSALDGPG